MEPSDFTLILFSSFLLPQRASPDLEEQRTGSQLHFHEDPGTGRFLTDKTSTTWFDDYSSM